MEEMLLTPLPTVSNPRVLDMSFCYPIFDTGSSKLGSYKLIPRFTLAALMFVLAVARLSMDSYREYKAIKRWKTNQYISLLVREGILYFLAYVPSPLLHALILTALLAGMQIKLTSSTSDNPATYSTISTSARPCLER